MWILRLNMNDRSSKLEEVPERYKNLGGRGLTSTLIYDEVDPECHPLGPNNKLIFAPGIVTGTSAPTSARVCPWVPSRRSQAASEVECRFRMGPALARMGIKALIVEGQG